MNHGQSWQISWIGHGENMKFHGLSKINRKIPLKWCKQWKDNKQGYFPYMLPSFSGLILAKLGCKKSYFSQLFKQH